MCRSFDSGLVLREGRGRMLHLILALWAAIIFLAVKSLFFYPRVLKMPAGRDRDMQALRYVQDAFRRVLKGAGVTFEVEGLENLPENEPVLIVGNHRSYFDVIIGYTLVKEPTGFIAKDEIRKLHVLTAWMNQLHCLFLNRTNIKQNLRVILQAISLVRNGVSIWIYPEGTRSKSADPEEMGEFKAGSFKIAEKAKCRIVPVAMINTREILERQFPRIVPSHVKVKIGEPIDLQKLTPEEREDIAGYTKARILQYIRELEGKA